MRAVSRGSSFRPSEDSNLCCESVAAGSDGSFSFWGECIADEQIKPWCIPPVAYTYLSSICTGAPDEAKYRPPAQHSRIADVWRCLRAGGAPTSPPQVQAMMGARKGSLSVMEQGSGSDRVLEYL